MTFNNSEITFYQTVDGRTKLNVRVDGETIWLTQTQMAELFQMSKHNIRLHINNAFKEGKLEPFSVVNEYLTTAADGNKHSTKHYNLDVNISVGYCINSVLVQRNVS